MLRSLVGSEMSIRDSLYTADPQRFANISKGLENARAEKDAAEERWLMLAEAVEG